MAELPTPRPSARQLTAALLTAMLAGTLAWSIYTGSTAPTQQIALTGGTAWLLSPDQGLATLIDGPSEQPVATVRLPSAGPEMSLSQQGASAIVADDQAGTVTRIDGATFARVGPFRVGAPGSKLHVEVAGDVVYVIDSTARIATVLNAQELTSVRTIPMAARPGPDQILVTGDGRLWAVDADGTGLRWFDADGTQGQMDAAADDRLASVDGRGTIVATGQPQPTVSWLGEDGSRSAWECRLAAGASDDIGLLGADSGERMFAAVPAAGTLLVTDSSSPTCGGVVPVGDPTSRFGSLVQSGPYVFVPNLTNGRIYVVDTRSTDSAAAQFDLNLPDHNIELVAKDGLVFYNDLDSEKAGVLTLLNGTWVLGPSLQKFNPEDPGRDVIEPSTTSAAPSPAAVTSAASASGNATPSTAPPTTIGQTSSSSQPATSTSQAPASTNPSLTTRLSGTGGTVTTSRTTTSASSSSTGTTTSSSSTSSSTTPSPPPPVAPAIDSLSAAPDTIGVEASTTLKAAVRNASGAEYQVSLSADGCSYVHTFERTPVSTASAANGSLSIPIVALPWGCPGDYTVTLTLNGPGGSATPKATALHLVAESGTTPQVDQVTCTPVNPAPLDPMSCTAVETVVGSRGSWRWVVQDADDSDQVVAPVDQSANVPFTTAMPKGGHFTVGLTVSYRGITGDGSADIRTSVLVPDVVGVNKDTASSSLLSSGLDPTIVSVASHQPAQSVLSQTPTAGSTALFGDPVTIGVSSGPNPTQLLSSLAPTGSWYTDHTPALPWNGNDGDSRGFALFRSEVVEGLGGGTTPVGSLETHPEWIPNGMITGDLTLTYPVLQGDHFLATLGFRSPSAAGDVTFQMRAVMPNGTSSGALFSQHAIADGSTHPIDVDLTSWAGATHLVIRVDAGTVSTQDWACWVDARVE